ncbi:SLOG family protein [Gracilibacillus xinjiangensis]|uniref:SLOG family protein n=1 Tax=Gracilibacillus xinjiangensis TaxID=1193282 RepID=A0ABV8WX13_9BACI
MIKVLTITGNKPNELNITGEKDKRIEYIKKAIRKKLISFIDDGLEWVVVTGQLGIELWTCEVICELKEKYPIKLGIFPPFLEYSSRWPDIYQEKLEQMIMEADFSQPLYNQPYQGPYQFINKDNWLIEKSDACLILGDEDFPGSVKFFLDKAKKAVELYHYQIFWITPYDLEDIVNEEQDLQSFE